MKIYQPDPDLLSAIDYIRKVDAARDQSSTAIEYYGNRITRTQYWTYINQHRKYFLSLGIQKNDVVTICMVNSPEYEFIFLALMENGSIASTVSKSFINADLKRQTIERNAKTLILSVEFVPELIKTKVFEQLGTNAGEPHLERIIFTTAGDYMPEEKRTIYNHQDFRALISQLDLPKNIEIIYPGEISAKIQMTPSIVLPDYNLLNSIATYSNTGGTTGAPKCACHTHQAIISLLKSHERDVFPEFNLRASSRSLLVIPISHITSQFYALLTRRAHGATIVYNPNAFEPEHLAHILIDEKIDDVVLPFGLYHAITQQNLEKGSLRLNTPACGGEPTPYIPTLNVNRRLKELGSNPIIIGTGSTEFGSGFMASYGINNRCNESGYFFPYAEGFLIDPKTGQKIHEPGKFGIMYAHAPWQMEGYLNNEKATKDFFHLTEDGKLYGTNNDIAEIVGEHNGKPVYSMHGRATDFVKSNDHTTYYPGISFVDGKADPVDFEDGGFLFEMRDALLNIEGILEAQPVLIPHHPGTIDGYPVANITISPAAKPADVLRKIYAFYYNHSAKKILPAGIIFRTHFERSLSSDKREVLSLVDDRYGYFFIDERFEVFRVSFLNNGNKHMEIVSDVDQIKCVAPPSPKLVYSTIKCYLEN